MKFCSKCGSRLKLEGNVLRCPICGTEEKPEEKVLRVTREDKKSEPVVVVGEELEQLRTMPTTNVECPKCGNREAYYWFVQTRSADEPSTQFYRCTKCGATWRYYG
jgi:DNA-directed RNA polymerase subunit M